LETILAAKRSWQFCNVVALQRTTRSANKQAGRAEQFSFMIQHKAKKMHGKGDTLSRREENISDLLLQ
jgi:hypothetical protein